MPPLSPQITLTATLMDVSGNNVGSMANASQMRIALVNYGPVLPCVPGTCNIDKPGPIYIRSTTGTVSVKLWGNDVIYPLGTFYDIALLDDRGNIVQAGAFQFSGTETVDLSSATPLTPGQPTLFSEPLLGDGITIPLTVPHSIIGGTLIGLYYNGGFQRPGVDYTMSGQQVNLSFTPYPGDTFFASYFGFGADRINLPIGTTGEVPAGAIPGTVYTLAKTPANGVLIGLFYNGGFQFPPINYTLSGQTITLNFSTYAGDSLYAVYIPVV